MNGADIEERLREALRARAASVEPEDRLVSIEHRLQQARRRRLVLRATIGMAAAAAAIVAGVLLVAVDHDRELVEVVPPATQPATTAPATTSPAPTAVPSTATTSLPDTTAPDGAPAIWPAPGAPPFASPEQAALSFARDFLGMGAAANVVGSRPMTERAAVVVDVRPRPTGQLVTHVQTRAVGTAWVVEAAAADNIELSGPPAMASVTSPIALDGRSRTSEATLYIEARPLGSLERIGEQIFTMGGAAPDQMAPFAATLTLPPGDPGVIVLVAFEADSSGEGVAASATVVPVNLTG